MTYILQHQNAQIKEKRTRRVPLVACRSVAETRCRTQGPPVCATRVETQLPRAFHLPSVSKSQNVRGISWLSRDRFQFRRLRHAFEIPGW